MPQSPAAGTHASASLPELDLQFPEGVEEEREGGGGRAGRRRLASADERYRAIANSVKREAGFDLTVAEELAAAGEVRVEDELAGHPTRRCEPPIVADDG